MKNDKETRQHGWENTSTGVRKVSSIALTLQLLNKEKEKHKAAENTAFTADAAKVRCKTCFKEIAPKRLCSGHGGGGATDNSADKTTDEKAGLSDNKSLLKSGKTIEATDEISGLPELGELVSAPSYDPDRIADLIAKELLLVDNNRNSLTLTIKLLCVPDVLTKEQRVELKKYMDVILTEFNRFKEENDLSDDCVKVIQGEGAEMLCLQITMPSLTLFDAFIQRLANNLIPVPIAKAQERDEFREEHSIAPNPLTTELKLSHNNKQSKREEIETTEEIKATTADAEEQVIFNPSPLSLKPW